MVVGQLDDADIHVLQLLCPCNLAEIQLQFGSNAFCHGNGETSKGKVWLCPEFIFALCCVSFCSFLLFRKKLKLCIIKVWLYVVLKNGEDLHNLMAFFVLPEPVCELAILFGSKIVGFSFQAAVKWSCSLNLKIIVTIDPCLAVYGIVKSRKHDLCFIYLKVKYRTTPDPN